MARYDDGNYSIKQFVGAPVRSYPRPRPSNAFVLRQRVSIDALQYEPADVQSNVGDIRHPLFNDAILVGEEDFTDIGNGVYHYTEVYASVPDSYTVPAGIMAYPFPGWINQRPVTTLEVPVRRTHDFYLTLNPIADIPLTSPFRPVLDGTIIDTETLTDGGGVATLTDPTRSTYKDWVAAGDELLVVRKSEPRRYMGNIWERITDRVIAE